MKKAIVFFAVLMAAFTAVHAQKWDELTEEQKLSKLKSFREDNQKYLKDKLGMSKTQMDDIDNVNICFLSTLDRIQRYTKDEANKEKYADALWEVRSAQLDAIMGPEKHKQFAEYVKAKVEKAQSKKG